MKSILVIVITLGLILGAGYLTISEVSCTSEVLLDHCSIIGESLRSGDWEKAQEALKGFDAFWSGAKPVWSILINHKEIDNIDMALARIEQYIETGEKGLALGELSSLELFIKHIPDKEKVSLENVF